MTTSLERMMPTGTATPILSVRNLVVRFPSEAGPVNAVRGVNFDVLPGEVLGIVGESGSGKSVTSLAAMGLLPPSAHVEGSVTLQGREMLGLNDQSLSKIRGSEIAMVFQDPLSAFTPVYTIGNQIAEAVRVHNKVSKPAAMARAVELLQLVGIPDATSRVNAFPHEFSGGMRQRAMIAMAIANNPRVIIADEPTTALDVTVQAQVLEVLAKAQDETGAAMLLITHDLGVVAGIADRVAVMYAGRIVEFAPVDDLFAQPQMPYTLGLLGAVPRLDSGRTSLIPIDGTPPSMVNLPTGCPFTPRCPVAIDQCQTIEPDLDAIHSRDHLAACHRSRQIQDGAIDGEAVFAHPELPPLTRDARDRDDRPMALEVVDLVRQYSVTKGVVLRRQVGTVYAVDGVSLDLREGEALALVGESGCGKTSTIMEVLELRAPMGGRVAVFGSSTSDLRSSERRELRREVSVVFQDPLASLDPRLPIGDIIGEPLLTQGVAVAERHARVSELLRLVGLDADHANRYPGEFSGGQRQRIAIARALALEPKLLVLDEPVSALDVSIQAGVLNLLMELRARLGLAYLFVAHDLSVVRHLADRVAVMYLGRIVEIGEVTEVFEHPHHPYTQALLSAVPIPDPARERSRERIVLAGDLPSPTVAHVGCRFRSRCWLATEICQSDDPHLLPVDSSRHRLDHTSACHHAQERSVV